MSKDFYNDYPDVPIPEFLKGAQWEDVSWHNDITGSSRTPVSNALGNHFYIRVWVYDEEPQKREVKGVGPRFVVQLYGTEESDRGNIGKDKHEELMHPTLEMLSDTEDEAQHQINVLLYVLGLEPMYEQTENIGGPAFWLFYYSTQTDPLWHLAAIVPEGEHPILDRIVKEVQHAIGITGGSTRIETRTDWVLSLNEFLTREKGALRNQAEGAIYRQTSRALISKWRK